MQSVKQKGFTLVELMVALTLSLILMAGVLSIFFSSKVTYFANEKTSRLQENGRVALDLLIHDIRSAGYPGCAKAVPFTTTLNNPGDPLWNYALPLRGYESTGGGAYAPALDIVLNPVPIADSDVIVTRMLSRDGRAVRLQTDLGNATADPDVSAAVQPGVAMITDCNASTIFQVTGYAAPAVQHATGGATAAGPGNASADLGYLYQAGARILPVQTIVYWVGDDGTGPALWRQMGTAAPEMLIEGVQALQISYGEDRTGGRIATGYYAANNVANWDDVISVTVSLLVRSEETGTDIDSRTYLLLDAAVGGGTLGPYNDRRQRLLFTTTAALRNRAL